MRYQIVDVTFVAVATPNCANVLVPVAPVGHQVRVSLVIAIDTKFVVWLIKVIVVPTAYATLALLSIVKVRAFASAVG